MFLILRIWDSLYHTAPLRENLQRLFGPERNLFSAAERPVRVAVVSSKDSGADKCLITNYNRPLLGADIDFEREDESDKEMKVWEAALATSAAPFYFSKFEKPETKKDYTDGALHANFPVPYTLEEIASVWGRPDGERAPLDILVSLGTGIQKREIKIPLALRIGGFEAVCTSFHNNLDCEGKWREFERGRARDGDIRGKVHRLNAHISGSYVSLDDYKRMAGIEVGIVKELKEPEAAMKLESIADALVANLFFFEPAMRAKEAVSPSSQQQYLPGSIRCRLARDSSNLKALVDVIESFWYMEFRGAPATLSPPSRSRWAPIPFTAQQRHGVKSQGKWLRVDCTITPIETDGVQQVLAVSLRRNNIPGRELPLLTMPIPISGFPISFQSLKRKAHGQ